MTSVPWRSYNDVCTWRCRWLEGMQEADIKLGGSPREGRQAWVILSYRTTAIQAYNTIPSYLHTLHLILLCLTTCWSDILYSLLLPPPANRWLLANGLLRYKGSSSHTFTFVSLLVTFFQWTFYSLSWYTFPYLRLICLMTYRPILKWNSLQKAISFQSSE